MRRYRIAAFVLACLMLFSNLLKTPVYAASSSEIRKQINALKEEKEEIKEKIAEIHMQYEENEDEIANIIAQKNVIDQEIQLLYAQITNINEQISAYNVLIADKQDELDTAEERYTTLNEANKIRIRTMEEEGGVSYWEVIFKAKSFTDLLDRLNMVAEIAEADRNHMQELSAAADEVKDAQKVLAQEKTGLEEVMMELEEAEKEQTKKRQEAEALVQELLEKADDLEALEADFEAQEAAFLEEIAAKELEYDAAKQAEWEAFIATYEPPTTAPPSTNNTGNNSGSGNNSTGTTSSNVNTSGGWVVPCSYTSITSPFGYRKAPTSGASTYHQGVDLDTGTGWPVVATRAGTAYTAYSSAAGNYITIDHHDGFRSVYMHLSGFSISNGTVVSAGQQIGLTGNTGVSTGDHLHFGISLNGVFVNPCQYVSL